jgi:hypothetical protein
LRSLIPPPRDPSQLQKADLRRLAGDPQKITSPADDADERRFLKTNKTRIKMKKTKTKKRKPNRSTRNTLRHSFVAMIPKSQHPNSRVKIVDWE